MTTNPQTWCLVLAANPHAEVMLARCDEHGRPIMTRLQKGPKRPFTSHPELYTPWGLGGMYRNGSVIAVLDSTPRTFDDARAIAAECPRGKMAHIEPPLTAEAAKRCIADAIAKLAAV